MGVATSTLEGEVLFSQNLNPATFQNTPLQVEASLWDRYRLKWIKFNYCPNVGTSTDGSLVGGFDPDCQDESGYAAGQQIGLARFCAHETAAQDSVYRPMSWLYRGPADLPYLYVSSDLANSNNSRWTSPGIFALLANTTFSATNAALGVLWFDAEYEFTNRNVEAAVQGFAANTVTMTANAVTTTPLLAATLVYKAGTQSGAFIKSPTVVSDRTFVYAGLDPAKSYFFRFVQTGLTTVTAAGAITVPAGFGTSLNTNAGFSSTSYTLICQATPSATGALRFQLTGPTAAVGSVTATCFITSLPTTTDVVIT